MNTPTLAPVAPPPIAALDLAPRALPAFEADALVAGHREALARIAWAVEQLPAPWHHRSPGGAIVGCEPGAWSVAENLAHLYVYEDLNTLPALTTLATGGIAIGVHGPRTAEFQQAQAALRGAPVPQLLSRLWAAHWQLAALARSFAPADFNRAHAHGPNPDFLFDRSIPGWLVAKSLQHFWEHGATVQRVLLFASRA